MTPERIAKLEQLGFAWDCRNIPKDKSGNNNSTDVASKPPPRTLSPTTSSNVPEDDRRRSNSSLTPSHDASSAAIANSTTGVALRHALRAGANPSVMGAYAVLPGPSASLPLLSSGASLPLHSHSHLASSSLIPLTSPLLENRLLMAAQRPMFTSVPVALLPHAKPLPAYLGPQAACYPYLPPSRNL